MQVDNFRYHQWTENIFAEIGMVMDVNVNQPFFVAIKHDGNDDVKIWM